MDGVWSGCSVLVMVVVVDVWLVVDGGSGDGCGNGGGVDDGIDYDVINDTAVNSLNDR